MSCRSTHAGTLATRLARAHSGLPDKTVTSLFHALKREGANTPVANEIELDGLRIHLRDLTDTAGFSPAVTERSERDLLLARDEKFDAATFHALANIEARARQEAVLRSVKGLVVDLDPPGSQSAYYEYGLDGRPAQVWYASYGSNLSLNRFMTYVEGGTPEGSTTEHEGCRDKTPPEEDIAIRFAGRMHFAAASSRWDGGGVAFMDNDTAGHALGRAYLLKSDQFDDVVSQENGKAPGTLTTDMGEAIATGQSGVTFGLYGNLVHIGDYAAAPVFTFTSSFSAKDALEGSLKRRPALTSTNNPSNNYVRMIGSGLAETFEMSVEEQADYLRGSLGLSFTPRDKLITILSTPADPPKKRKPAPKSYKPSSSGYGKSSADGYRDYGDTWGKAVNNDGSPWPPKRDYDLWWEDGSDKLTGTSAKTSASHDDDFYSDSDWYGTSEKYGSPTLFDDIPMALYDTDGPDMSTWGKKRCPICDETTHDIHTCPRLR